MIIIGVLLTVIVIDTAIINDGIVAVHRHSILSWDLVVTNNPPDPRVARATSCSTGHETENNKLQTKMI